METVWSFETAKYRIVLQIAPSMELYDGDDEDGEIQRKLDDGVYVMFDSIARVYHKPTGIELGSDALGMSVYENPSEFWTGAGRDGYFRDMVRQAIKQARQTKKELRQ